MKILLLENISRQAVLYLESKGHQVTHLHCSPPEQQLIEQINYLQYDAIGIRSKTKVTRQVLEACPSLKTVVCFCIGTDQVDLEFAQIPVFNSPFSNTRSVAEWVIANVITLARQMGDRNIECHAGAWNKTATGCHEIRGKTIGIVGYGHVGQQVSVLAESMGMNVVFFDTENVMAHGNATRCDSLKECLKQSDFVTLHVPGTTETDGMIGEKELDMMKSRSYLLNASRGNVIQLDVVLAAVDLGHLAGVALDVYPYEPADFEEFQNTYQLTNVIFTPHIGGSTEEAQDAIGLDAARKMDEFLTTGTTKGSVNFPQVTVDKHTQSTPGIHRLSYIHKNERGAVRLLMEQLDNHNINIIGETLATKGDVGYLVMDIECPDTPLLDSTHLDGSLRWLT